MRIYQACLLWALTAVVFGDSGVKDCPSEAARKNDGLSIECSIKLRTLTDGIAEFSRCMARSSWPLRSCTKCFHLRKRIDDAYDTLMKENSTRSECSHELQDWDPVGPVALSYGYYTGLVQLARCDLCLLRLPSGEYQVKSEVIKVLGTYNDTVKCFKVDFPAHKRVNASGSVCDFCRAVWRRFSTDMQAVIINPDDWQSCRDVMDMANRTWALWTEDDCERVPLNWWAHISNLALIMALVVSYYGGMTLWYRDSKRDAEQSDEGRRPRAPQHLHSVDMFGRVNKNRPLRRFTR